MMAEIHKVKKCFVFDNREATWIATFLNSWIIDYHRVDFFKNLGHYWRKWAKNSDDSRIFLELRSLRVAKDQKFLSFPNRENFHQYWKSPRSYPTHTKSILNRMFPLKLMYILKEMSSTFKILIYFTEFFDWWSPTKVFSINFIKFIHMSDHLEISCFYFRLSGF